MHGVFTETPEGRYRVDEVDCVPDGFGWWVLEVVAYTPEPSDALEAELRDAIPNPYAIGDLSAFTVVTLTNESVELY